MSPQLLWTIAGLILTVLTLGGVTISSYQSMDSATAKLVASEMGNVATASKLWLANDAAANSFTGITSYGMRNYIPDLVVTGTDNTSTFASKASTGVTYKVVPNATTSKVDIIATFQTTSAGDALAALVHTALTGKACTGVTSGAALAKVETYTCNG